jgi:hypothetical protein
VANEYRWPLRSAGEQWIHDRDRSSSECGGLYPLGSISRSKPAPLIGFAQREIDLGQDFCSFRSKANGKRGKLRKPKLLNRKLSEQFGTRGNLFCRFADDSQLNSPVASGLISVRIGRSSLQLCKERRLLAENSILVLLYEFQNVGFLDRLVVVLFPNPVIAIDHGLLERERAS